MKVLIAGISLSKLAQEIIARASQLGHEAFCINPTTSMDWLLSVSSAECVIIPYCTELTAFIFGNAVAQNKRVLILTSPILYFPWGEWLNLGNVQLITSMDDLKAELGVQYD
jgi:hypothetical protein